jgi:hypothetical protein
MISDQIVDKYFIIQKTPFVNTMYGRVYIDDFNKSDIYNKFNANLLKLNIISNNDSRHLEAADFGVHNIVGKEIKYIFYFFLHTKDFHGVSKSHFELNKTNKDSLLYYCGDLKFFGFVNGKEQNKIEQFDFRFVWFTKEERSCTVYLKLKSAIESYSVSHNDETLMKDLHRIWEIHDEGFRNDNRERLFKSFFEHGKTTQIDTLDLLI